jgi:putative ABC transport system substrate-binding protein
VRLGQIERFSEITAEFVRLKVDVIITTGAGAAVAKQMTSVIPIVFTLSQDPIGSGLVTSLSRPGGNVTGLLNQQTDLAGKRIELLRQAVPSIRQLVIFANVGSDTPAATEVAFRRGGFIRGGGAGAFRRAGTAGGAFRRGAFLRG